MEQNSSEQERRFACANCAHVFLPLFPNDRFRCPKCGAREVSRVVGWHLTVLLLLLPVGLLFVLWMWGRMVLFR